MKRKLKIVVCVVSTVFAILSLAAVLGSLGVLPAAAAAPEVYSLREFEGYVGVFYPANAQIPTTVTDICVRDLPVTDRLELAAGISTSDYQSVVRLLEDFGS